MSKNADPYLDALHAGQVSADDGATWRLNVEFTARRGAA